MASHKTSLLIRGSNNTGSQEASQKLNIVKCKRY